MAIRPLEADEVPAYSRILADSDMDGLFGAAVLKAFRPDAEVVFSHAAELRSGLVDDLIDRTTVLVDLPFVREIDAESMRSIAFFGSFCLASFLRHDSSQSRLECCLFDRHLVVFHGRLVQTTTTMTKQPFREQGQNRQRS